MADPTKLTAALKAKLASLVNLRSAPTLKCGFGPKAPVRDELRFQCSRERVLSTQAV